MKPNCRANRRFFPSLIAASFGAALISGTASAQSNRNWSGATDAELATATN